MANTNSNSKKDALTGAIKTGADLFFSANDTPTGADPDDLAPVKHRAQDETPAQLQDTIDAMATANQEAADEKAANRELKKNGAHIVVNMTPSMAQYIKVMSKISGKSMSAYINAMIEREAAQNADLYRAAQEIVNSIK